MPPIRIRRRIVRNFERFFDTGHEWYFRRAMGELCRFYRLPRPLITWYERLGKRGGDVLSALTCESGRISLIHPENWRQRRKYKTRSMWVCVTLHEFGHYYLWAASHHITIEHKADRFRIAIMKGVA